MRAETQKSAPFKDLLKSWLLDENAHKYLAFLCPKFPPDFLFSLASLDSFPPGEAIGCCRTRGFIDSLKPPLSGWLVRVQEMGLTSMWYSTVPAEVSSISIL